MSSLTADHYFWCSGVFLAVLRVFRGIVGCSRGVPRMFRGVPGCSGGVPGCSGVFRVLQTSSYLHINRRNVLKGTRSAGVQLNPP